MKTEIKQIITVVAFDEGDGLRIASICSNGPAKSLCDAIGMVIEAFTEGGDSESLALGGDDRFEYTDGHRSHGKSSR